MTTGSWDPGSGTVKASARLDAALLKRFLHIAEAIASSEGSEGGESGAPDSLEGLLAPEDRGRAEIMQLPTQAWQAALSGYSNQQLLALIRFFTLAEMQLPGWQAGVTSPVIAINSVLKSRGYKLEKPLLQWIRKNSSNRFLPNGPVG
ncbi:MAG: hypothetical protein KJP25_11215 [Gammaproteobacteria bacterium]|nr:hypothetical protein [Gammaproteobacteria bacterium]NND39856.1 hypothetical protein [Pseudomonadales bacterium]MBT8149889.1 hypothetical protein [Gammaproteobacteria bacterium]NNL10655.1 hypothetical protein [Pseudomonadales bacterium]NNM12155.1 hypothetical protein [Pseudomonadales bacterium]